MFQSCRRSKSSLSLAVAYALPQRSMPDSVCQGDLGSNTATIQHLYKVGTFLQACDIFHKSYHIQKNSGNRSHALTGNILVELAGAKVAMSCPLPAMLSLTEGLQHLVANLGAGHPDTALAKCRLAACKADLGK